MLTAELYKLLRIRYQKGWALIEELRGATGAEKSRFADAVAFGLFPSRGLEIIGFELKVSRSDWLRELKSPEKAEIVCKYCDKWYVVAGDGNIVKDNELPPTWGLMVATGQSLRIEKEAVTPLSPIPIDRTFLASIVRHINNCYKPLWEINEEVNKRAECALEAKLFDIKKELREAQGKVKSLQNTIDDFEKATGIPMSSNSWEHNPYLSAAAIKAMLNLKKNAPNLLHDMRRVVAFSKSLEQSIEELEPIVRKIHSETQL